MWKARGTSKTSPVGKLLLLHIFPGFGIGGAQLRIVSIMNALGASVAHAVLALDGSCEAAGGVKPPIELRMVPPPAGRGGLFYPLALRRAVKLIGPDVLLTYNWGAIDGVLGAAFRPPCPIIHNECGFGPDEAAGPKFRRVLIRHFALSRVYRTVVVSETLLKLALERFKLLPQKVQLIRTGVDAERFRPGRNEERRARLGIAPDEILFGYVGGLRREKNLELLIRSFAAAELTNGRLTLVGDGPCRQDLERLVDHLGIRPKVLFEGHVPDPASCLTALDVFVMSSATEQTPNALLEGMACGLPAIATDVGDTKEMLSECGWPALVPSNDLETYRDKLRTMASRPDLRKDIGAANRRRAVKDYSMQRMVDEYRILYYTAAGRLASTNHS
jgi:glycosyltransferase involved in cell wall biosynthesis